MALDSPAGTPELYRMLRRLFQISIPSGIWLMGVSLLFGHDTEPGHIHPHGFEVLIAVVLLAGLAALALSLRKRTRD